MSDRSKKPAHSKAEAILKASTIVQRRPPKNHDGAEVRAEWRENHWRVWLFDGWIDLDDNLEQLGMSEDVKAILPSYS